MNHTNFFLKPLYWGQHMLADLGTHLQEELHFTLEIHSAIYYLMI